MSKAIGTNRTHRDIFVWCRHDHVAKRELPVGYVNAPVVLVDLVCGPQATVVMLVLQDRATSTVMFLLGVTGRTRCPFFQLSIVLAVKRVCLSA